MTIKLRLWHVVSVCLLILFLYLRFELYDESFLRSSIIAIFTAAWFTLIVWFYEFTLFPNFRLRIKLEWTKRLVRVKKTTVEAQDVFDYGTLVQQHYKQLNAVYDERNQLVAALSKLYPSHLSFASDAEDGFLFVVIIDSPHGQLSWHVPNKDLVTYFSHLSVIKNDWDGHTTEEKYQRLRAMTPSWHQPKTKSIS